MTGPAPDWDPSTADPPAAYDHMRATCPVAYGTTGDWAVFKHADIVRVLDHLGWPRAVLVGHSMGGRSATCAAARQPERIAGLALIDFSPDVAPAGGQRVAQSVGNTPDAFASVEEAMKYFHHSDRERYEAYLRPVAGGYAPKRDPFFRNQFRRVLETGERPKLGVDLWQLIGEVRCPVLSMRGGRSDMYAVEAKEKMRAANARLAIVEVDAGHDIAGENLQGFLAALRPFLASLEEKAMPARGIDPRAVVE